TRGAEVVDEINAGQGSAQFYRADFGSLEEVRQLAGAIIDEHQQLHLMINNAGLGSGFANGQRQQSADGNEMIFQVNYLAHFLLTALLLPMITTSAPARIINVASAAQRPLNFEDLNLERNFD